MICSQRQVLIFSYQKTVSNNECFHLGAHETAEGVAGVTTIGSPRTLKHVLIRTEQPVRPRPVRCVGSVGAGSGRNAAAVVVAVGLNADIIEMVMCPSLRHILAFKKMPIRSIAWRASGKSLVNSCHACGIRGQISSSTSQPVARSLSAIRTESSSCASSLPT